jgi:hypothetical protein
MVALTDIHLQDLRETVKSNSAVHKMNLTNKVRSSFKRDIYVYFCYLIVGREGREGAGI